MADHVDRLGKRLNVSNFSGGTLVLNSLPTGKSLKSSPKIQLKFNFFLTLFAKKCRVIFLQK